MIPIGGFQPLTLSDFPGTPAALVFVRGCTMRCPYCHNRALWDPGPVLDTQDVLQRITSRKHLLDGVVISGGEPTMHAGLPVFLATLRALGLRIKLDTNGSRPAMLATVLGAGLVDHVALDAKADAVGYDRATGSQGLHASFRSSLGILRSAGIAYEVRTTVCQGLHDTISLSRLADDLRPGERWFLQAYRRVPDADPDLLPPAADLLAHASSRAQAAGIHATIR